MTIHQKIIVLTILILFFISSTISAERCHPDDKKALLQIKQAFNNAGKLATLKPNTDCCEWYLVECDESTNRVSALTVADEKEVTGRIPDVVGDLPHLLHFYFTNLPKLIGPIPQAITKLKNLNNLAISNTNITGPIPAFLSKLTNLEALDLSDNKFTGSIPDSFDRFKRKRYFNLWLARNYLSGLLPKSIGQVHFDYLDISGNKFTGDVSFFFGNNKVIQIADLSRNKFTFDMSKVEFPKSLYTLELSHNKIYGSLPKSLTEIPYLSGFNVSYNQLCGQIPKGGELDRFDKSSYAHNKCLCGAPLIPCKMNVTN